MLVLVACEESQEVCTAFRKRGHTAFSCDLQECGGGHPEWHIRQDVRPLLDGRCTFRTDDGTEHTVPGRWDLIIAHPPCTYLTVTGNRWFNTEVYGQKAVDRLKDREEAVRFFMAFAEADCDRIAIENPIGHMSSRWRKPDQIIQPYQFGHPTTKATCLWLKGLPLLIPTDVVEVDPSDRYAYVAKNGRIKHDTHSRSKCKTSERSKHRSKTFRGVAEAMADQWGQDCAGGVRLEGDQYALVLE